MPEFSRRTIGINLDPSYIDAGQVSTAHQSFAVQVDVQGSALTLGAGLAGSGTACWSFTSPDPLIEGSETVAEVAIVRFVKYGRAELSGVGEFEWLITMDEGNALLGQIRSTVVGGAVQYPAPMKWDGRMAITLKFDEDQTVTTLKCRDQPILEGIAPSWPPYGMELSMTGGPIHYYRDSELLNSAAEPFLTVLGNTIRLSDTACPFLTARATILTADRLASTNALRLTWDAVTDDPELTGEIPPPARYHVYANRVPGRLETWHQIGAVAIDQTTFVDTQYCPGMATDYVVLMAAECPFEYWFEGLPGFVRSVDAA
jgi:hypothetical protein